MISCLIWVFEAIRLRIRMSALWYHTPIVEGIRVFLRIFFNMPSKLKKRVTWCVMNSSWHHSCCLFLLPTWRSQNSPEHSSPYLESCSEAWFWEKRYSWLELAGWIMEICWTLFEDCQQTRKKRWNHTFIPSCWWIIDSQGFLQLQYNNPSKKKKKSKTTSNMKLQYIYIYIHYITLQPKNKQSPKHFKYDVKRLL